MGDFFHEIKVSKEPILSSKDWKKINKKTKKCGNCKSENTVCIHSHATGCNIGWDVEEEFFCNDCGFFTLYEDSYES